MSRKGNSGMTNGSGGGGGGGRNNDNQISSARINKQVVDGWMNQNSPSLFLSSAPSEIDVGGVPFDWIGESKSYTSSGREVYNNTYQSRIQASNGEYPVIETVVREVRSRGTKRYEWDKSTFGTGLR